MAPTQFPVIDPVATGANILRLRREQGFTVRDLQRYFGFEEPQAIYKWQRGQSLPSVDNLYALSALLDVPMNEILVSSHIVSFERQASACRSNHVWGCWNAVCPGCGARAASFFACAWKTSKSFSKESRPSLAI